ncbi:M23 family metallopeptidase [Microbacterium sp. MM2322]|uniref:murein hydrolase activator EnvC family protein n=1 Tax=Microbacterium sp. MM2322 TaxID=3157631 RepID=UPI0032D57C42
MRPFRPHILALTVVLIALTLAAPAAVRAADAAVPGWRLPVPGASVLVTFDAPEHDYAAGHRGIDIGPVDGAVLAPADGVVAFAGTVVDRGVVTIDHGDGWVTSVEPVEPTVSAGDLVTAGDRIGQLSHGGHAPAGTLHVGVRRDGEYVNPLLLLGRVPRAILLPCC